MDDSRGRGGESRAVSGLIGWSCFLALRPVGSIRYLDIQQVGKLLDRVFEHFTHTDCRTRECQFASDLGPFSGDLQKTFATGKSGQKSSVTFSDLTDFIRSSHGDAEMFYYSYRC